ncbi:unnamed protein product [Phytophthora fragariaefolia]|uniref:Unnamed protein product n=1 Tax=Phytophthora fragariaefolia TaxID=1490495 RepID=A0A9W6UD42_9STRA|nr:unnamed protein product [Phytophthora fragariaefolia]
MVGRHRCASGVSRLRPPVTTTASKSFELVMMSTTTASTFTTKLKQFTGAGFPAWGAQVKLELEIKGLRVIVTKPTLSEAELKSIKGTDASAAVAGMSTLPTTSVAPLNDRVMKENISASIILTALNGKLAVEVYTMKHLLTMLRPLCQTFDAKCSASIGATKREFMGLYLDGVDSMVQCIKTTRRVFDEPQYQSIVSSTGSVNTEAAFNAKLKSGTNNTKSKKKRGILKIKCCNCNQLGHFARTCTNASALSTVKKETARVVILADDMMTNDKREWIVDSGATSHMTVHVENMVDVHTRDDPRSLTVASGEMMLAVGKTPLRRDDHEVRVLQGILAVKGIARNLVSVAVASCNGMKTSFKGESCGPKSIQWLSVGKIEAASSIEDTQDEVRASVVALQAINAQISTGKQHRKHYSIKKKRDVLRATEGMNEREAVRTQGIPRWTINDWRKSADDVFGYKGSEKTLSRTPGRRELVPFGIELITLMKDTRRDSEVLTAKTMASFVRNVYPDWLESYIHGKNDTATAY